MSDFNIRQTPVPVAVPRQRTEDPRSDKPNESQAPGRDFKKDNTTEKIEKLSIGEIPLEALRANFQTDLAKTRNVDSNDPDKIPKKAPPPEDPKTAPKPGGKDPGPPPPPPPIT